ncbi:MAG: glutamate-5-semialdehyde dehydrogenase [Oscillospiraceae bacterium]|nr:glutamate-5-semialdehyde dehydrogenase [Oscillospiraceae bacterium]
MKAIQELGERAQTASRALRASTGAQRNEALAAMAEALSARSGGILAANEQDLKAAAENGMTVSLQDRLRLTGARVQGMRQGILEVMEEKDPLGLVLDQSARPNGLRVERVSVPLGVIALIYEARPNVTADAAALCLKSGNAVILRGGKEAIHSNTAIADTLRQAVASTGLPADCVQLVADTSRESAAALMRANGLVDVLIPRGGAGLIRTVVEQASVPVIETGVGVCHVYVDKAADAEMGLNIIENAKTSRPSVCNAIETILVHGDIAAAFLPALAARLAKHPVELRCDEAALAILKNDPNAVPAAEDDWAAEYGELILAVKVVADIDGALAHLRAYSTRHSEAIVTGDEDAAARFLREVDAAAVYVNASTRFTDGGEFGYGAEIGISTQRLHARGPLGLRELTSYKYLIRGEGQIR